MKKVYGRATFYKIVSFEKVNSCKGFSKEFFYIYINYKYNCIVIVQFA